MIKPKEIIDSIIHRYQNMYDKEVTFKLDNTSRKEIRKVVKVIWVNDLIVGAQFIERKFYDNDLGFYLNF